MTEEKKKKYIIPPKKKGGRPRLYDDPYHNEARRIQREYTEKNREVWNLANRIGVSVADARKMLGIPNPYKKSKPKKSAEDFLAPED